MAYELRLVCTYEPFFLGGWAWSFNLLSKARWSRSFMREERPFVFVHVFG